MRVKKLMTLLAAGGLAMALASSGALAQAAAPQGNAPVSKPGAEGLKVTLPLRVKNMKVMGGYYLQGISEVYGIANKIPEVLEPLAKSGETVTIEALARGDLLTILTINGQKYGGQPQPATK
jgi:hypothetical protein